MKQKTKLNKVFDLFVGNDKQRPSMLSPFVIGDKTYATDAYTLVRCDNDKIDFEFDNKETPPSADKIIPLINTSEIIDLDSIDWQSFMTNDEEIQKGEDIECGNCNGYGTCNTTDCYKGRSYYAEYECPVCEGSGIEKEAEFIKTGNKTFKYESAVRLKGVLFRASILYKLKKVQDILNLDVELISNTGVYKPMMFKIGFLEVLIMPITGADEEDVIIEIK